MDLKSLAEKYFRVWNTHNSQDVGNLFHKKSILKDWEILEKGRDNIIKANQAIFDDLPKIKCEIKYLHISASTKTVCAEINVILNNENREIIDVIDVIQFDFDESTKKVGIVSLRAYKS
jgi:hypothetical protein